MTSGLTGGAVLACALGVAVTARPVRASEAKPAKPDLSGTWRLNEKESDNPRDKMREGLRRGPRGGGFGGGGMGGRGGGPMGGRGDGFPGGSPGMGGPPDGMGGGPGGFERMRERFRTLTVRHKDPVLKVEYGDESDDTFYTDGRKVKREDERGWVEVQTKWKDGRVVVERDAGRGKATETLELSADRKKLIVTTKMEAGPMGSVAIKRVYDVETDAPAAVPPAASR